MSEPIRDTCELCGASQHDRPLVKAMFRGDAVFICVACMPSVCRGLDAEKLAEKMREERTRTLNTKPIARPGLRY
jgi:hypothetical protein